MKHYRNEYTYSKASVGGAVELWVELMFSVSISKVYCVIVGYYK